MEPSRPKNAKESKMESVTRTWTARPILNPEITEDPPLHEVYVGILKEKKHISTAIPIISNAMPGFHHLKRCASNKLLLAPVKHPGENGETGVLSQERLKEILTGKGFDTSILEDDFQVMNLPSRAVRTKAQAARISKIWPVNFHPDPNIESLFDGSVFDARQLDLIENYMKIAIEAAQLEAIGNMDCNGSAVIVDPEDGRILAIAASRIDLHPMWHASMLAIDLVARLQGGGAWMLHEERPPAEESLQDEECDFETRQKRIKRKYDEDAPLYYPKSLSQISLPVQSTLKSTVVCKGRKNQTATKKSGESSDPDMEKGGAYLCTGYWAFLLKEPCPLCAMALLHSRVLRIFYGIANQRTGMLGSQAVLHAIPGLNHRYQVWSGILEQECLEVAQKIEDRITR